MSSAYADVSLVEENNPGGMRCNLWRVQFREKQERHPHDVKVFNLPKS